MSRVSLESAAKLLLLEGNARRQRREVPVNVPVCLLTAEAEYVQALGWYHCVDRLADTMDDDLQVAVLVQAEVVGDLFPVLLGCD
jgi:hypothetical protein